MSQHIISPRREACHSLMGRIAKAMHYNHVSTPIFIEMVKAMNELDAADVLAHCEVADEYARKFYAAGEYNAHNVARNARADALDALDSL